MIFQNKKTLFQAIKTISLKSGKVDIFPNGLTHGFGLKMAIFSNFFFQAIQKRITFFMIFYNVKTPVQAIKTRCSKSRKIDIFQRKTHRSIEIFQKGLTHGFGLKMAIFSNFFFQAIQTIKMYSMIFQNEKTLFQAIKRRSSKIEKLTFFQRDEPLVLVQKLPFFQFFFFQAIQTGKMYSKIFQTKKTPF